MMRTASPGITSWAGLDSFDAGPTPAVSFNENNSSSHLKSNQSNGTKLKNWSNTTSTTLPKQNTSNNHKSSSNQHQQQQQVGASSNNNKTASTTGLASAVSNTRVVDTNSKVSGWLQSTSPQQQNEQQTTSSWSTVSSGTATGVVGGAEGGKEEDFGWTTVAKPSKVSLCVF